MLKNPLLEEELEKPKCRCATCFNSFWLRQKGGDGLQCICQISKSKTYYTKGFFSVSNSKGAKNRSKWVTECEGAEDDFKPRKARAKGACTICEDAMWQIQDSDLKCYCRKLNLVTFGKEVDSEIILDCNGVKPIEEV